MKMLSFSLWTFLVSNGSEFASKGSALKRKRNGDGRPDVTKDTVSSLESVVNQSQTCVLCLKTDTDKINIFNYTPNNDLGRETLRDWYNNNYNPEMISNEAKLKKLEKRNTAKNSVFASLPKNMHDEIRKFLTFPDNLNLRQTCYQLHNHFGEGTIFYVCLKFNRGNWFKAWPAFENFDAFRMRTRGRLMIFAWTKEDDEQTSLSNVKDWKKAPVPEYEFCTEETDVKKKLRFDEKLSCHHDVYTNKPPFFQLMNFEGTCYCEFFFFKRNK